MLDWVCSFVLPLSRNQILFWLVYRCQNEIEVENDSQTRMERVIKNTWQLRSRSPVFAEKR